LLVTSGQVSDFKAAEQLIPKLKNTQTLLADKGYDSAKIRNLLTFKNITPCIPPRKNKKIQDDYDKSLYKSRHKIENFFSYLKDFRRIHTRFERNGFLFKSIVNFVSIFKFFNNY
jgi:putative transposase